MASGAVVSGAGTLAADRPSASGNSALNSWSVEDGLPGNAVWALAPTHDGYLWVAGLNGLARFDGVRFVRFRIWDGLTSLQILHLLEDRAGRLWIGSEDAGLTVREGGHFHGLTGTNGCGGNNVRALAEDAEGKIWVAHEKGLARWEGGHFVDTALPKEKSGPAGCNYVFCGSNSVWAVNDSWMMHEWRDGQWRAVPRLQQAGLRLDRVFQGRDGVLWSQLHPFGLARMDGDQWRVFGLESGLPKSQIKSVLDQGEGRLLCGSYDLGLFLFQDGRASPAGLNQAPDLDGVLALQQDNLGNLWVGTKSRGLQRLGKARVQTVPGSERARIARIAFDNRDRLWLSSGEELWFEQEGQFITVPPPAGGQKFSAAALKPRAAGGVWIAVTGRGLWQHDPERNDRPVQKLRPEKGDYSGVMLAEAAENGYWFATESGSIGRLTEQSADVITRQERPGNKRIIGMISDSPGGVWVRIEGTGIVRLDAQGKVIERLAAENGLPVNAIRCWLGDGEGGLWLGTPAGLYWWRHSKLLIFDSRDGLPEEVIANLAQDLSGDLWCAANNRLFRLTKKDLEEVAAHRTSALHPLLVGRSSGLAPVPFAAGIASRAIRGPHGRLYFPRIWDVLTFDPADFQQPEPAPHVRIEEAFADGRQFELPGAPEKPLRIPAGIGELVLRYTALQCAAPETLHFRYRLEGIDEHWTEVGDQRMVSFRRLPPGPYSFRVSASAAGGAWAEPGESLAFIILPSWYQTWWFRGSIVAALGGLLGLAYRRRVARLESARAAEEEFSRRLMESQEQERQRLAAELHDSVGQNLLVIKNRALMALERSATPARMSEQITEVSNMASLALREVRGMAQDLRPFQLDELGSTKAILAMIRRLGESSKIQFKPEIVELDGELPKHLEIHFYRIVQELLTNVLKHSQATEASVTISKAGAVLCAVVQDNGCGFEANQPHSQASPQGGFGLRGLRERVRTIGGRLRFDSRTGAGTTVTIEVPIEKSPTKPLEDYKKL
jgi:signal transduction histidine kinase/ligand-binding sensor domain-containing protein